MKKLFTILFLCLLCSNNCFAATSQDGSIAAPLASYVFNDGTAIIHREYYEGDCTLVAKGSGTITITLQRQNTYDSTWVTYDYETSSKSFYNTLVGSHTQDRTLTYTGKYRCKMYATARVGNYTDTKTVYSPVLTIY